MGLKPLLMLLLLLVFTSCGAVAKREHVIMDPFTAERLYGTPVPGVKMKIKERLEQPVSFDFLEKPIERVLQDLQKMTGICFVLDPVVLIDDMGTPMNLCLTLRVDDMKLRNALNWISRLLSVPYAVKDEAIFFSKTEVRDTELVIYDIESLGADFIDNPAPGIGLFGEVIRNNGMGFRDFNGMDYDGVKDLIECTVRPEIWCGEDERVGIDISGGKLIITAYPEIHTEIRNLFIRLKNERLKQVRVNADFFEISEGLAEFLKVKPSPRDKSVTVFLEGSKKTSFDLGVRTGTAKKIDSVFVSGANGQMVHSLSGVTVDDVFTGTAFQVQPIIGFASRDVILHLDIKRNLPGEETFFCKTSIICPLGRTALLTGTLKKGSENRHMAVLITPELLKFTVSAQ